MWISIQPEHLEAYMNPPQLEFLQVRAQRTDQSDPLLELIADVCARIRLEVAAGGKRFALDPQAGRIPPELKGSACALVLEALQTRWPGLALTADQVRQATEARSLLARVARGELPITPPGGALGGLASFPVSVARVRPRQATGSSLRGL